MGKRGPIVPGRQRPPAWCTAAAWLLLMASGAAVGQQPVVVGGDRAYPPFHFLDGQGSADGFDVALFREVAREAGLVPRFALGEWEQSLADLEAGRVDVVPMFVTPERARRFLFSRPFLQRHHRAFARRDSRYIGRLEDLRGERVAVQNAGLAAEALQALGGVTLVRTDLEAGALSAVAAGDATFALVPSTIGYAALLEHDLDGVVAVSQPLLSYPYAFAVAPGNAAVVDRIDAALARVQADGTADRLYLERLANLQPPEESWRRGVAFGAGAALLLAASWLGWRRLRRGPAAADRRDALMDDLSDAIAAGQLGLAVQPKLDLRSGRVSGAELLVRWQHPRLGLIAPVDFIARAEQAGLLGQLSLYMVGQAARWWRSWHAQGLDLVVSVNVSISDLADGAVVDAILARVAGPPHTLRLEITEDTAMHSPDVVLESVRRLRERGVGIALDDFGIGHSTLSRLQRLSPEELKIDRSFVTGLLQSPGDQSIVRSSIELAHRLGALFTAEGIEDEDTLQWLDAAGCDEAQGYFIARPMPPEDLPAFCATHAMRVPAAAARSRASSGLHDLRN